MNDYIKLAKHNVSLFESDKEVAEYIAFLFSELAVLDRDWNKTLDKEAKELESES